MLDYSTFPLFLAKYFKRFGYNRAMKPKILLTTREDISSYNQKRLFHNFQSYFEYVQMFGGIPHMIGTHLDDIDEIIPYFDGLLITGGDDVNPKYYGEENQKSGICAADLEAMDFALYHAFKNAKKPIFGICRGLQVINVAEGGSLIQDIPSYSQNLLEHNQLKSEQKDALYYHTCHCVKGTMLASLLGDSVSVNSYHHQAIKELAPSFIASVISEDGLIEGIEKELVFAVQWHPERMLEDLKQNELMKHFLSLCTHA